jgi:hypothetical protein
MAQEPPWNPDDTGAVPVGPEPEPTGAGGGGTGPGGWGEEPRTEPFAVAAMVWAVVSIVIPLVGTVIAFVLASKASDSIRESQGTRKGEGLVTAARVVAAVVLAAWILGLILFFALRDNSKDSNVVTPTQPSVTSTTPLATTTSKAPVTTAPVTTLAPATTTSPPATTAIIPPPLTTTSPPPTTSAPATTTSPPPTTTSPPPTTSPAQKQAAILEEKMLANSNLGPSNRGVPDAQQYVVTYTPGQPLVVTWAINNGAPPLPTGPATCAPPVTTTTLPPGSTTTSTTSTTTTTTTTTTTPGATTTTVKPSESTQDIARSNAKAILQVVKSRRNFINITEIQLVGTYPMDGKTDTPVVEVTYPKSILSGPINFPPAHAFDEPPAETLTCINPAFE